MPLAQLGEQPIPLADAQRIIAIGSDRMMAAVKDALANRLNPHFPNRPTAIGSINSPMQCMMKEIFAQCLHRHVDPVTKKESFVFSCFNQDQLLHQVDFGNLNARLRQNSGRREIDIPVDRSPLLGAPGADGLISLPTGTGARYSLRPTSVATLPVLFCGVQFLSYPARPFLRARQFVRSMMFLVRGLLLGIILILAASGILLVLDAEGRQGSGPRIWRIALLQHNSVPPLDDEPMAPSPVWPSIGFRRGRHSGNDRYNAHGDFGTSNTIAREILNRPFDLVLTMSTPSLRDRAAAPIRTARCRTCSAWLPTLSRRRRPRPGPSRQASALHGRPSHPVPCRGIVPAGEGNEPGPEEHRRCLEPRRE